jgi:hypothetical protein
MSIESNVNRVSSMAAIGMLLVMTGCVSVTAARLESGPPRSAIAPDSVRIYRTAQQVNRPYDEVALLNAKGDYAMTSESQMYEGMRKKAAKMGANGVILDAVSEPTTGQRVAQAFLGTPASRKGQAVAIYIDPLLLD